MARLPEYFTIGDRSNITPEFLLIILERMYTDLAVAINQKPDLVQRHGPGLATDTFLSQGTINIDLDTDNVEMLTNHPTASTVTWTTLS